jgi:hypothetical protein
MTGQQDQNSTQTQIQKVLNRQQADDRVIQSLPLAAKKLRHQSNREGCRDELPEPCTHRERYRRIQSDRIGKIPDRACYVFSKLQFGP